jgi:hypothetical protein
MTRGHSKALSVEDAELEFSKEMVPAVQNPSLTYVVRNVGARYGVIAGW